jgi:hypothetical protein
MAIEHEGKCPDCDGQVPDRHVALVAIGEMVHLSGDNMAGDTEYRYFQCPTCGLLWTTYRDYGGVAGNDTFHRCLTDDL